MAPKHLPTARHQDVTATESEPLLANDSNSAEPTSYGSQAAPPTADDASSSFSPSSATPTKPTNNKRRWPSLVAILVLGSLVLVAIVIGFVAPPAIQTYIEKAVVLEPTSLALDSISLTGIRARVQGNFRMDAARVDDDTARRIGSVAMRIMRTVAAEQTHIKLYVPGYDNAMVGSAVVPPLQLNLVDGVTTFIDVVADMKLGDNSSIKRIVNDWLTGKISELEVKTATALQLKSGFISLGTHEVVESMVLEAKDVPTIPEHHIQHLDFYQVPLNHSHSQGIEANVTVSVKNKYPVALTIPRVGFDVLVSGCTPQEPKIVVATGSSSVIDVEPETDVTAEAQAVMSRLPDELTRACPSSAPSPFDELLRRYLDGRDTVQVFIRGSRRQPPPPSPGGSELPPWLGDVLENVTVPVSFAGSPLDSLLRNFSLTDVAFSLPSPFAPDDDGRPRVSGTVVAVAALPRGLGDVDLAVRSIRCRSDVLFKDDKFGELNLKKWQRAESQKMKNDGGSDETLMRISSRIADAPIDITDTDVFSALVSDYLFGDDDVVLGARALLDATVATVLGDVVVRDVAAEGDFPVGSPSSSW